MWDFASYTTPRSIHRQQTLHVDISLTGISENPVPSINEIWEKSDPFGRQSYAVGTTSSREPGSDSVFVVSIIWFIDNASPTTRSEQLSQLDGRGAVVLMNTFLFSWRALFVARININIDTRTCPLLLQLFVVRSVLVLDQVNKF